MSRADPKAHVLTWRSEILEEFELANSAIPGFEKAHEDATAAARDAVAFHEALQYLLGVEKTRLEPATALRLKDQEREVKDVKLRETMAAAALETARARAASLRKALAQIDRIIPPGEAEI